MIIINIFDAVKDCMKFAVSMTIDLIRILKEEKKKERLCLSMA